MAKFTATFLDSDNLKAVFTDDDRLKASFGASQCIVTGDYEVLANKPQINGVTLIGNKTSREIHVQDPIEDITSQDIDRIIFG